MFQHIQTDIINYIYQNEYTHIYRQTFVINKNKISKHTPRPIQISIYINTCGHTGQYYSTYIYTHMHVYIWVGRGVWALLFNIQLLRTINCHCSLLQFVVYLLQRNFFVNGTTEAHISTQQSALGHYGPQAQGVPITVWPNRFYGREE